MTNIHREFLTSMELGIAVQNTEEGQKLAGELVTVIREMKTRPDTKTFLESIYPPYNEWQIY
ncbi:MAG: hypothetical protein ABJP82_12990 [Hyphomicrobiales bacterium]